MKAISSGCEEPSLVRAAFKKAVSAVRPEEALKRGELCNGPSWGESRWQTTYVLSEMIMYVMCNGNQSTMLKCVKL